MFGISLPYLLKHPVAAAMDIASDPLEMWIKLEEKCVDWSHKQPRSHYESSQHWETILHQWLNADWPCDTAREFDGVWEAAIHELERNGIQPGPGSFRSYNDGDAGLTRAIWCLIHHLKPDKVVETGVAHGVTSRIILEALQSNNRGHLWSIDLPPLEREWQQQVGVAVTPACEPRWSYIKGSSRRRLPLLLSELGQIDLFIHDSLHSSRNVLFELERAWACLRPGGAIVVDDVDVNSAFEIFTRGLPANQFAVCDAEPITPDLRRFNHKGLFGLIFKE